jgi:hypothetical protein
MNPELMSEMVRRAHAERIEASLRGHHLQRSAEVPAPGDATRAGRRLTWQLRRLPAWTARSATR